MVNPSSFTDFDEAIFKAILEWLTAVLLKTMSCNFTEFAIFWLH